MAWEGELLVLEGAGLDTCGGASASLVTFLGTSEEALWEHC